VSPFLFHPMVLALILLAGCAGTATRRRRPSVVTEDHFDQFTALQASVLTLLGLLLGFSFSMAVGRYDDRRKAEIAEANAIGVAYERTSTLDGQSEVTARDLMRQYVRARIAFFEARGKRVLMEEAKGRTADLQVRLWASGTRAARIEGNRDQAAEVAAYLTSLTQVFVVTEERQSAYENRIPTAAWALLIMVSAGASFMVGLGMWRWNALLLLILPIVVSSTLTLVYDLDSPGRGLIHVRQDSMERVRQQVESGR